MIEKTAKTIAIKPKESTVIKSIMLKVNRLIKVVTIAGAPINMVLIAKTSLPERISLNFERLTSDMKNETASQVSNCVSNKAMNAINNNVGTITL